VTARDVIQAIKRLPGGLSDDQDAERVIAEALHQAHAVRPCPLCGTKDASAPECDPVARRLENA